MFTCIEGIVVGKNTHDHKLVPLTGKLCKVEQKKKRKNLIYSESNKISHQQKALDICETLISEQTQLVRSVTPM